MIGKAPTLQLIPPGARRDWQITVDEEPIDCRKICVRSTFGEWTYGWHPHGYDTCWFAENAGGGVITLPYCAIEDEIWVGLVLESRPNMGGERLCAIGGYIDAGEAPDTAAKRELVEEVAYVQSPDALTGQAANPNRAMFIANSEHGEGTHFYCLPVDASELQQNDDDSRIWNAPADAELERILFFHWREAIRRTADGLALAGIARLLAERM